jgi:hypothetical protein
MEAASVTPSNEIRAAPSLLLGVGLGGFIDGMCRSIRATALQLDPEART